MDTTTTSPSPGTPATGATSNGRSYIGANFRLVNEFLGERGLLGKVREQVTAETRQLMDKPPFPFAWTPAAAMDDIQRVLSQLPGGRDLCVDLGLAAGRKLGGSVIQPVLRMATSLFGTSPAAVYGNLDRFYCMVVRGFTCVYEEGSANHGYVVVSVEGAVHPSIWDVTRGNLLYLLELLGTQGSISPPEIQPGATAARYEIRWS